MAQLPIALIRPGTGFGATASGASFGLGPYAEALTGGSTTTAQRGDVYVSVAWTSLGSTQDYTGTSGWTQGYNQVVGTDKRLGIFAHGAYRSGVDTTPGTLAVVNGTNGNVQARFLMAGGDMTTMFTDAPTISSGTGTTLTSPSLTLTLYSRVVRIYFVANDEAISSLTPGGAFESGGTSVAGTDWAWRVVDEGLFDPGSVVPSRNATITNSTEWTAMTIAVPVRLDGRPIIMYSGGHAWSGTGTTRTFTTATVTSGWSTVGQSLQANDLCLAILSEGKTSDPTPNNAEWSIVEYATGNVGGGVAAALYDGVNSVDTTFEFGSGGTGQSIFSMVIRNVEEGTPYHADSTAATNSTMSAPALSAINTADIALVNYFTASSSGDTTPGALSTGLTIQNTNGSSGSFIWRAVSGYQEALGVGSHTAATSTQTTNNPQRYVGIHVILHAVPPVRFLESTGSIDSTVVFDGVGAPGPTVLVTNVEVDSNNYFSGVAYRPQVAPDRRLIWVYNYAGQKVGVVD
jgi:hypothetical protein